MKTSRYLFVACVGGFLLSSCYKDKGDYVYNEDIHDISVKLESVYGMRKSDGIMICNIDPEIETADGDKSYLEYVWIRYNEKSGVEDTVCKTELFVQIQPSIICNRQAHQWSNNGTDFVRNNKTILLFLDCATRNRQSCGSRNGGICRRKGNGHSKRLYSRPRRVFDR